MDYKMASPDRYGLLKAFARENRQNMTLAESVLWDALRAGYHVLRSTNDEVLYDLENVLYEIEQNLK